MKIDVPLYPPSVHDIFSSEAAASLVGQPYVFYDGNGKRHEGIIEQAVIRNRGEHIVLRLELPDDAGLMPTL